MNKRNNSKIIVIEGNIGSGKSTLLKLINDNIELVQTIKEPVCQWQAIGGNPDLNLLDAFYKDPKRYAYTFQSYAYYSRLKQWSEMEITSDVAIAERSVLSDKHIFALNGYKSGLMDELEWQLYQEYFDWQVPQFHGDKIDGIIYLETDPEICQTRIGTRGREEEKDTIPLDYLRSLHERHEEWLKVDKENSKYPTLVVNGSQNFYKDEKSKQNVINQIKTFIKNL